MLFFFFCLLSSFVLNHHVWFIFALYLVFFFLLFLAFVAFIFCNFLNLGYLSKNISETLEIAKNTKMKNAQKRTFWQEQLAQMCSQIVSFFLFCVSLNFAFFAENTIKIGVSAKKKKKNTKKTKKPSVKNWSKLALKTGPSMLRNQIGPVLNARNVVFFLVSFSFFLKNPLLSAGRMRFSKTKKQKHNKIGPGFNTRKGKNWTSF